MNVSFIDRLLLFMEKEGINDNQMTVSAGLSVGVVGKMRKGITKGLNSANIEKILYAYPNLSATWLLTGKGEIYISENNEHSYSQGDCNLIDIIRDQAEEIGRLKLRIEQLERGRGDNALDVASTGTARVG